MSQTYPDTRIPSWIAALQDKYGRLVDAIVFLSSLVAALAVGGIAWIFVPGELAGLLAIGAWMLVFGLLWPMLVALGFRESDTEDEDQ